MSLTKVTFDDYVADDILKFENVIAQFAHGKCYIGEGILTKSEADSMCADLTTLDTALGSDVDEISDLGEEPGSEKSEVEKLKTSNYLIEGKRTNTVELTLVGINQDRKDWLEQQLNKTIKTIVLVSASGKDVIIFNGMRWSYDRETTLNGLFSGKISTEYKGPTGSRYLIYMNIEPATVG
jgi:hypothetical protein